MRVIVSDTSPLHYLVTIDAVELLPRVFTTVFIPSKVVEELSHPKNSAKVRNWVLHAPVWLQVRSPISLVHSFNLDVGEAHAILLAQQMEISSLLIDERKGFEVAESLGLKPIGLLGLLELCAEQGWIDFEEQVGRLRTTNFRVKEQVIDEIRARLAAR